MAIGLFRANEEAATNNNLRLEDPTTPGTQGTDTLSNADLSGESGFKGIKYTGKDGVNALQLFKRQDPISGELVEYTVAHVGNADGLRASLRELLERHEVDPIITINEDSATSWDIVHKGAGTITKLVAIDGTEFTPSRS